MATYETTRAIRNIDWGIAILPGRLGTEFDRPKYVNNEKIGFKHPSSDLILKFYSNWKEVERHTKSTTPVCPIYFPPSIELSFDAGLEAKLAQDLQAWPFLHCFNSPLVRLGIDLCRSASIKADVCYEQRVILTHYFTWIFLVDEVTEKLPYYGLHSTAGKIYLENLKSILRDGPVKDLSKFEALCNDELIRSALDAQKILADDIMPLMKKDLSAHHYNMCVETLDLYFDYQYYEGESFMKQPTSEEVLRTRGFTIGTIIIFLLYMTPKESELFHPQDPCLVQLSVLIALFHDLIGIHKDVRSLQTQDDASAHLNLIKLSSKEYEMSQEDALYSCARRLNDYIRCFEFFVSTYMPERGRLYCNLLKLTLGMFDYHLNGILGKPNNRYGWEQLSSPVSNL